MKVDVKFRPKGNAESTTCIGMYEKNMFLICFFEETLHT